MLFSISFYIAVVAVAAEEEVDTKKGKANKTDKSAAVKKSAVKTVEKPKMKVVVEVEKNTGEKKSTSNSNNKGSKKNKNKKRKLGASDE